MKFKSRLATNIKIDYDLVEDELHDNQFMAHYVADQIYGEENDIIHEFGRGQKARAIIEQKNIFFKSTLELLNKFTFAKVMREAKSYNVTPVTFIQSQVVGVTPNVV